MSSRTYENPAVYFCGDLLFALIWTRPLLHYYGWIVVVHTTTKYIVQTSMYTSILSAKSTFL